MTAPEPLSSSEARRIATTLLANLANVGVDSREYGNVAMAALAYVTLAPQLGPSQAEARASVEAALERAAWLAAWDAEGRQIRRRHHRAAT